MRYYINIFFAFFLCIIIFVFILDKNDEKSDFIQGGDILKAETIDSLQHLVDSLHSEVLPLQIELGRYQVAFDIFMERHPKSAKQYETILSQETE
jgi:hypothetical protein